MEFKKINNVLVSSRDSKLKLCNILFDDIIREMNFVADQEFEWNDLEQIEKRNNILNQYVNHTENDFLLAMPGGIDPHVHFNTPGFEAREDFAHASNAAIYGGTTTVIDMPCTSLPPVTSIRNLEIKRNALTGLGKVNCHFWGGVSGCNFDEQEVIKNINELADAGVIGFKVYVVSGMETFTELTYKQIEFVASVVAKTGLPLAVHAEDKELVLSREKNSKLLNQNNWKAYCNSRDIQAEVVPVNKMIEIAEKTGCRVHIVHLSSASALSSIIEAQSKGIKITTETCPHYLYFTQQDFENKSICTFLKTAPPVKFEEDKQALWNGLQSGAIEFVTTDHAGSIPEYDKISEDFWKVYGGIPGVEHRVPFLFSEGFLKNKITFQKTVELLSTNAAKYFNLKNKGRLEVGKDADLILFDLWDYEYVHAKNMHSKGKHTPFEGVKFNAIIKERFIGGKLQKYNKVSDEK